MDNEPTLLTYFEARPAVGRRRSTPLWVWALPLAVAVLLTVWVAYSCKPECFSWWFADWWVFWGANPFRALVYSVDPAYCTPCKLLPGLLTLTVACVAWAVLVVALNPPKYVPAGFGAIVEIDPCEAASRTDVFFCPAELASFVRERMMMTGRNAATIMRLKAAVTRWMDERSVPSHLREAWMTGAMAAALVLSPEERALVRLTHAAANPDARDLGRWLRRDA